MGGLANTDHLTVHGDVFSDVSLVGIVEGFGDAFSRRVGAGDGSVNGDSFDGGEGEVVGLRQVCRRDIVVFCPEGEGGGDSGCARGGGLGGGGRGGGGHNGSRFADGFGRGGGFREGGGFGGFGFLRGRFIVSAGAGAREIMSQYFEVTGM